MKVNIFKNYTTIDTVSVCEVIGRINKSLYTTVLFDGDNGAGVMCFDW